MRDAILARTERLCCIIMHVMYHTLTEKAPHVLFAIISLLVKQM